MVIAFDHELKLGLEAHLEDPYVWRSHLCSFKMIDACIFDLPDGKEKGVRYSRF